MFVRFHPAAGAAAEPSCGFFFFFLGAAGRPATDVEAAAGASTGAAASPDVDFFFFMPMPIIFEPVPLAPPVLPALPNHAFVELMPAAARSAL